MHWFADAIQTRQRRPQAVEEGAPEILHSSRHVIADTIHPCADTLTYVEIKHYARNRKLYGATK
jgi:hypothetical protein